MRMDMRVGVCMWYIDSAQPLFHRPVLSLMIPFFHSFIDSWKKTAAFLYSASAFSRLSFLPLSIKSLFTHYFIFHFQRASFTFFFSPSSIPPPPIPLCFIPFFPPGCLSALFTFACLYESSQGICISNEKKKSTSLTCKLTHVNYAFIAEWAEC